MISINNVMCYFERDKIRNKLNRIFEAKGIQNKNNNTFQCGKVFKVDYGYSCLILIPLGLQHEQLKDLEGIIKSNFGLKVIVFESKGRHMILKLITKTLEDLKYEPIKCKNYEIYVGYNELDHIKVDLNTFPHVLLTGGSGSGKSRLLFMILCNLIQSKSIDLYMAQIAKKELNMFNECAQIKYVANKLKDLYVMLKHIDDIRVEREDMIGSMAKQGVFNLEDYNRVCKKNIKYMYVLIDEMAFLMSSKADSKDIKKLKDACFKILLDLLRAGRSSGIFLICCLQQPDKESLPGSLRRMFQTILCMKQPSKQASELVLGKGDYRAFELNIRDLLVVCNGENICKVPYIDFPIIRKNIESFEVPNHKYINLSPQESIPTKSIESEKPNNNLKKEDGIIRKGA